MKNLILLLLVVQLITLGCTSSPSASSSTATATATAATQKSVVVDLDPAAFKAKMTEPHTIVLDVRTQAEIAEGKIPGAFDLDVQSPEFRTEVGNLDQAKTYLIYCKKGGRSSRACSIFEEAGFKKVYNLKGGYDGWVEAQ